MRKNDTLLLCDEQKTNRHVEILHQLQEALPLSELPAHIECFDNSNFQGSYPVSGHGMFQGWSARKK